MPRISIPTFRLFTAPVEPSRYNAGFDRLDEIRRAPTDDNAHRRNIPEGIRKLRWTHEPNLGLPRQPFKVWRHKEKFDIHHLLQSPVACEQSLRLDSSDGEIYYGRINLRVPQGSAIMVFPIDRQDNPIYLAAQMVGPGSHTLIFHYPFTKGYRFMGNGTVEQCMTYLQAPLINSRGWDLIQEVGFPFDEGSIQSSAYDTRPQGIVGALVPPRTRAQRWLMSEAYLHEPLPGSSTAGSTVPEWAPPPVEPYLKQLEQREGGLLPLIKDCLERSQDQAIDPTRRQPAFRTELEVEGLRQEGSTGTVDRGTASVPVVGTTLLTTLMDNYAGVALGYGTLDNPDVHERNSFYMVTNEFILPPFSRSALNRKGIRMEFAALAETLPAPKPLDITAVSSLHRNRPMRRDAAATEAIKLTIKAPNEPNALGLLRHQGGMLKILNTGRGLGNNSYQPHIPNLPNVDARAERPIEYTVPNVILPLAGNETSNYGVTARDIFGRWSTFTSVSHTATALPPQRPGLISVKLDYDPGSVDPGRATVRCRLAIEISWDWTERTPHTIEVGGLFYPADTESGLPATVDRLSREATNIVAPLGRITFPSGEVPQVSGAGLNIVQLNSRSPGADPAIRKYRLTVDDVVATFPGPLANPVPPPANSPSRVAYGTYIRALEKVRHDAGVMEWSDWSMPMRDVLDDPRPPLQLNLPADVTYTALPDATNVARGTLRWPVVDRAVGYMVWQASESALRTTLGEPQYDPTESYVDRATFLERVLNDAAKNEASLRAFVRLNRDPLTKNSLQIEMPGTSDVLFVYRVNAVTASGVESLRSNAVFFAVPRQRKPSPPAIKVDPILTGVPRLRVVTLPGPGPKPAGYRVYRIRKRLASNVVQMKGRPAYTEDDPAWDPYEVPSLVGKSLAGHRIEDPVSPSWSPYYYQAVAVGPHKPDEGIYRAISAGSPTVEAYFLPSRSPMLRLATLKKLTADVFVLQLETDGPLEPVRGKSSLLEVYGYDDRASGSAPTRTLLDSFNMADAPETTHAAALRPGSALVAGEVRVLKNAAAEEVYIQLRHGSPKVIVRLTDPLGRSTDTTITL